MQSIAAMLLSAMPTAVQDTAERMPTIQVLGTATVETPPDRARISYWVAGEGKTADAASAALSARNRAIAHGVRALLGRDAEVTAGDISVTEVRGPGCERSNNFNPQLSEGACAVIGHVALLQGQVRTGAIDKAATAVGVAARLGARDARVQAYELVDRSTAMRRATSAAMADARARAEALAAGAGVHLGALLSLNDPNASNAEVASDLYNRTGQDNGGSSQSFASAIVIDVTPRPIQTQARVNARFAIQR